MSSESRPTSVLPHARLRWSDVACVACILGMALSWGLVAGAAVFWAVYDYVHRRVDR